MAFKTEDDFASEQATLREYLKRRTVIEGELSILKEDLKTLNDEFKDKIDIKTFRLADTVYKAKSKVAHKDTFESFLEILESGSE